MIRWILSLCILLALDYVYMKVIAKQLFESQIKRVQGYPLSIRWPSVILCYIVLTTILNYFILIPQASIKDAFLLGVGIYAVYETTTYALLKNWSFFIVIIDSLWGGILFALTTFLIKHFYKFNIF